MKKSTRNSSLERWVSAQGLFSSVDRLLRKSFAKSQIEKLNILENNLKYTISDQLCLRYIDNRYSTFLIRQEIIAGVLDCIETYRFLLDSDLDPKKIRYPFMKALMDVMSTGSGAYFL